VRSLLIAADRGKDGETSAERLRQRAVEAGVAATVALPPEPWGDWNDWSTRRGSVPAEDQRGKEGTGRVRPGAG
ncbi:MAG: toprim domain-containing protein, partial [Proteobacteria bacterium]|nr:toprim domain-containing protein [Pseudomonadota bacterium]